MHQRFAFGVERQGCLVTRRASRRRKVPSARTGRVLPDRRSRRHGTRRSLGSPQAAVSDVPAAECAGQGGRFRRPERNLNRCAELARHHAFIGEGLQGAHRSDLLAGMTVACASVSCDSRLTERPKATSGRTMTGIAPMTSRLVTGLMKTAANPGSCCGAPRTPSLRRLT